jgi:hypothetical protein
MKREREKIKPKKIIFSFRFLLLLFGSCLLARAFCLSKHTRVDVSCDVRGCLPELHRESSEMVREEKKEEG